MTHLVDQQYRQKLLRGLHWALNCFVFHWWLVAATIKKIILVSGIIILVSGKIILVSVKIILLSEKIIQVSEKDILVSEKNIQENLTIWAQASAAGWEAVCMMNQISISFSN